MQFQVDPLENESQRACSALLEASLPPSRSTVLFFGLYLGITVAAFLIAPATAATTIALSIAAVLATYYILRWDGASRVRRLQAKDPHALETHFVELGPDGIRTWCNHIDARYPWSEFTKVSETSEFILFIREAGSGCAIPKRLVDPRLDAELRARLAEWAPSLASTVAAPQLGTVNAT